MKKFFNNVRAIEVQIDLPEDLSLTLCGRVHNSRDPLLTPVPRYTRDDDYVEWIGRHFVGYGVAVIKRGNVTTPKDLDRINNELSNIIQESILELHKCATDEINHVFTTSYGEIEVTIGTIAESSVNGIDVTDELENSYLDYAMSVIVGRALPDVRDGLKPVHRRALYAMESLGNRAGTAYKKSARVVGDVIGKYHPHGDSAVYDTIVRMAQPFSLRYPLVDGQGNFGSIDGDSAAAMRYTEIRMERITSELMMDMDRETVDFVPNYDGTEMIPSVFPTRIPNLLVNGSSGIAVGMATNIPPHNLNEVIDGALAFIRDRNITNTELMDYVKGPDFPTGAVINGRQGIVDAYNTGRGKIYLRAVSHIETDGKREQIVVTEIPYQVNKARLIEKIAELVKAGKLDGISHLRDESDKDGMRIVIECKRDAIAEVLLNNLYSLTQLQVTFGINMVALSNGEPKLFDLRGMLEAFVNHRCEVVTRRTIHLQRTARERLNIVVGLLLARDSLDDIIEVIRSSKNQREAKERLRELSVIVNSAVAKLAIPLQMGWDLDSDTTRLTDEQIDAIVNLKLYQLTGLERDRLEDEANEIGDNLNDYHKILTDDTRLYEVIVDELEDVVTKYGDERLTEIMDNFDDVQSEDLIKDEQVVLTLSNEGYVKYQPITEYNTQRRGGVGKSSSKLKEDDYINTLNVCSTRDTVMCFSSTGRVYWTKVYQLPEASRGSRGKPIVNFLPVDDNETITAILPVREYEDGKFVFMATRNGSVKKVELTAFSRPRSSGIIAINLVDDDKLIGVNVTDGTNDIMLFSDAGKVVRFPESQVRPMGRTAVGVRGMKLPDGVKVVSLVVPHAGAGIITATENGYGKITHLEDYPVKGRGTQGVVSIKVSRRNGNVIGASMVDYDDDVMIVTNEGKLIRLSVAQMSYIGRNTLGVKLMYIDEKSDIKLVSVSRIAKLEDDSEDEVVEE